MLPASKEDPRSGLRPLWAEVWVVGMLVDPAYVALGWVSIRGSTATRGCRSGVQPPWWGMGRVVRLGWRPGWSIRGSTATRGRRSGVRPPWWGMGRVVGLGWRPGWSIRGPTATRGRRSGVRPPWWGMGRVVRLGWRPGWSIRGPTTTRGRRSGVRPPWQGMGRVVRLGWRAGWPIRGSTATRGRRSGVRPPWWGMGGVVRLGWRPGWSIRGSTALGWSEVGVDTGRVWVVDRIQVTGSSPGLQDRYSEGSGPRSNHNPNPGATDPGREPSHGPKPGAWGSGGLGPPGGVAAPGKGAQRAPTKRGRLVGEEGFEPSRPCGHTDLNRARLPFRHPPGRARQED